MFSRLAHLTAAIALLFALSLSASVGAQTAANVQVMVDKLNVRSGPGLDYTVISKVTAETKLPVLAVQDRWYQVQLPNGQTGWVAGWYVQPLSNSASHIESTVTNLNVRTGPAQTYEVITRINPGNSYPVLAQNGQWYQIRLTDGTTGWVAGWLVNETAPASDTQQPVDQPGSAIDVPGASPEPATMPASAVITLAALTNVYHSPDPQAAVIGQLSPGDSIEATPHQNGWFQITYDGVVGWILPGNGAIAPGGQLDSGSPAASPTPPAVAAPGEPTVTVEVSNLTLRSQPTTASERLTLLAKGTSLRVLAKEGDWYHVQTPSGQIGWVAGWLVSEPLNAGSGSIDWSRNDLLKGKVIVVDPGHGGEDNGATGASFGTLEKVMNLQVAHLLRNKLEAAGATVILTRSDDRKLSLQERVNIAVNNKADLFVSIHHNSHPTSSLINGTIVFYYHEGESRKLASLVQTELVKATNYTDLNARFGNYHVLRENPVVSILAEIAFLSNYEDERRLRTSEHQELAAEGIYRGIVRYFQ